MKIPEEDLKEIEKFWSLSGLYMRAYVLMHVLVLILSINLPRIILKIITLSNYELYLPDDGC